jgi:hypothetical protein
MRRVDHKTLCGITEENPIDAGVVAFTRDGWPFGTMKSMECQHSMPIAVTCSLPAINKPVCAYVGVHRTIGRGIEVAHEDGRQMREVGELLVDDVDGGEPRLCTDMIEVGITDTDVVPAGTMA